MSSSVRHFLLASQRASFWGRSCCQLETGIPAMPSCLVSFGHQPLETRREAAQNAQRSAPQAQQPQLGVYCQTGSCWAWSLAHWSCGQLGWGQSWDHKPKADAEQALRAYMRETYAVPARAGIRCRALRTIWSLVQGLCWGLLQQKTVCLGELGAWSGLT